MPKTFFILLLSLLLYGSSFAQKDQLRLSGRLIDEHRHEVSQAHVMVLTENIAAISDNNGRFKMKLPPGQHVIQITSIGFYPKTDTVNLAGDTLIEFDLEHSVERIDEYVLQGHKAVEHATLAHEELSASFFNERTGENFVESLERIPGVDAISMGTGISKPMIRGMSFNRVVVNNNGVKQEGQQWGADHGLEVDGFDVDRVEIIKGPSSLMYGSDGIGGMINILPAPVPEEGALSGEVQTLHKTNNRHYGATTKMQYRKGDYFIIGRYTRHDYADYRVPADSFTYNNWNLPIQNQRLINTAGREENASLTLGMTKDWGVTRIRFSTYSLNAGLFPGAVGSPRSYDLTPDRDDRSIDVPRQDVSHNMVTLQGDYYIKDAKLSVEGGMQFNDRNERSRPHAHGNQTADHDSALFLSLNTISGRVTYEQPVTGKLLSVSGISGSYQENEIGGFEYLIPEHYTSNAGAFQVFEYNLNTKWDLLAGARYDHAFIRTMDFNGEVFDNRGELFESENYNALRTDFGSYSASVGASFQPKTGVTIKINAGKSFRFPVVPELTGEGVHHGNFRHERGNRDMTAEHGYQFDLSGVWMHDNFKLSAAGYFNVFDNFIYLRPAPRFSRLPDGVQLWEYTQHDAVYTGYELSADYYPVKAVRLAHRSAYVYNYNLETGLPLPYSPPFRIDHEAEYTYSRKNKKTGFSAGIMYRRVFDQNRVDRNELATEGYHRFDFWSGITRNVNGHNIQLRFEIQNLTDQRYLNHLSRYRLINLPEQGRNFILRLIVPFTVLNKS